MSADRLPDDFVADGVIKTQYLITEDGDHTCALDFRTGIVCEFYRTERYGTVDTCVFAGAKEFLIRKDGTGYLVPGRWCRIRPV